MRLIATTVILQIRQVVDGRRRRSGHHGDDYRGNGDAVAFVGAAGLALLVLLVVPAVADEVADYRAALHQPVRSD